MKFIIVPVYAHHLFYFLRKTLKTLVVRFDPHFSQVGHNGPPLRFLGSSKIEKYLTFWVYQNVVLVKIFNGLARFFLQKKSRCHELTLPGHMIWFIQKKRRSGLEDSWVIFSNENYYITLEWISFDIKNIFMIVKFGGPLCPAWKRSIMPHLTFLTWHTLWRKWR